MFFASNILAKHNITAIFSDRSGGESQGCFATLNLGEDLGDNPQNIQQNLAKLCEASRLLKPHQARQVHGIKILNCVGAGQLHDVDADILITTESNVALAVRTADCLPILLADPDAGVIAAVHAGWRGTAAKVVAVAVAGMCDKGASTKRILASFGPCIQTCCFKVNAETAEKLCLVSAKDVVVRKQGALYADLVYANKLQLHMMGVLAENIEMSNACSSCNANPEYFSYRRDCGKTGRQLSMISMHEVAQ